MIPLVSFGIPGRFRALDVMLRMAQKSSFGMTCGQFNLIKRFPDLYLLAWDSDAAVADYVEVRHEQMYWHPVFIRAVQVWKKVVVTQLWYELYKTKIWFGECEFRQ